MQIYEVLSPFGKALLALYFLSLAIRQYLNFRDAKKRYPKIAYQAPQNKTDDWRWQQPPEELGLALTSGPDFSRLDIPSRFTVTEIIIQIIGYLLAAILLYAVTAAFVLGNINEPGLALFALGVFALLPLAFLHLGAHVKTIVFRPDRLIIYERLALFFTRKTELSHRRFRRGKITGRSQRFYEAETGETMPDYYLRIKPTGLLGLGKRLLLRCNPTQCSWIEGGMNYWKDR